MLVQFSQDVPSAGSDFPLLFDDSWMLVTCIPFFMMDLYYVPHTLMWPAWDWEREGWNHWLTLPHRCWPNAVDLWFVFTFLHKSVVHSHFKKDDVCLMVSAASVASQTKAPVMAYFTDLAELVSRIDKPQSHFYLDSDSGQSSVITACVTVGNDMDISYGRNCSMEDFIK